MGIGNLANKVSSDDVDIIQNKNNPPEFEDGFEDSGGDFSDLFDDIDDGSFGMFDDSSSSSENSGSLSSFGSTGLSDFGSFGSSGNEMNLNGGLSLNNGQQEQKSEPDNWDKLFDGVVEALKAWYGVFKDLLLSTKLRTADDWGIYSNNVIYTSLVITGISVVIGILGSVGGIHGIRMTEVPMSTTLSGVIGLGTGIATMGLSAFWIVKYGHGSNSIDSIEDVHSAPSLDFDIIEESDELDEALDDYFEGSDYIAEEDDYEEDDFNEEDFDDFEEEDEQDSVKQTSLDIKDMESSVVENVPLINRHMLLETFSPFLELCTQGFSDKKEIPRDSQEFSIIETICLKALAAAKKVDLEEIDSKLEKAIDSYFCYELRMKRVKGLNKLDDIAREMVAYFRDSSTDLSVNATVDLEGDFYKITITKGVQTIVTLGDCLKLGNVREFFDSNEQKLPIIAGVDEYGNPVLTDARYFDTMLIAGKPRSGKSWYVFGLILMMCMFNNPEDVQFTIVDPKDSNLFHTLSLLPHVCGLQTDENILNIMDDLINKEGVRRKALLKAHRCDDIWALRERKGVKLPVLYLVIDEVVTVMGNLGDMAGEFSKKLRMIITELPSLGIRLMFIPHRATGVVDKTCRTMMSYTAAVKSEKADILDTLGIKQFDNVLVNPGDVALKTSKMLEAKFVKGVAISTSDYNLMEFIESTARTFYKMGVDIPDMQSIGAGYNRDNEAIKAELSGEDDVTRVQFSLNDVSDIGDFTDGETYDGIESSNNEDTEDDEYEELDDDDVESVDAEDEYEELDDFEESNEGIESADTEDDSDWILDDAESAEMLSDTEDNSDWIIDDAESLEMLRGLNVSNNKFNSLDEPEEYE